MLTLALLGGSGCSGISRGYDIQNQGPVEHGAVGKDNGSSSPIVLDAFGPTWSSIRDMRRISEGKDSVVAVIDSGVDETHPALQGHVLAGYDAAGTSGGTGNPNARSHGTGMAGLIAASDKTSDVVGVAPGANILPIKATVGRTASDSAVAEGIRWAGQNGADVILLAYSATRWDDLVLEATLDALRHNVVVVVSAGNRGTLSQAPVLEGLVVVASVAADGRLQAYSGWATSGGVVAPGGDQDPSGRRLTSLAPGGGTQSVAGTSVSAGSRPE